MVDLIERAMLTEEEQMDACADPETEILHWHQDASRRIADAAAAKALWAVEEWLSRMPPQKEDAATISMVTAYVLGMMLREKLANAGIERP